jgi:hypothetical protein
MQYFCGRLYREETKSQGATACGPATFSPFMENIENPGLTTNTDFWRGLLLGTMTGMVIAAFTYGIVDRTPKLLDGTKPSRNLNRPA